MENKDFLSGLRTEAGIFTSGQTEPGPDWDNSGFVDSEPRLDRALRYVRSGAGLALGVVAIVEGLRSMKEATQPLRANGEDPKPDRLAGIQDLISATSAVVGGLVDARRHVRGMRPEKLRP